MKLNAQVQLYYDHCTVKYDVKNDRRLQNSWKIYAVKINLRQTEMNIRIRLGHADNCFCYSNQFLEIYKNKRSFLINKKLRF